VLSKASGTFTIDHPLDPSGMILNHYFVESPDMSNVYSGSVALNAAGRGEVRAARLLQRAQPQPARATHRRRTVDALLRKTSAGTGSWSAEAECEGLLAGDRDRRDPSAEITRLIMPVEQPKTGRLPAISLD